MVFRQRIPKEVISTVYTSYGENTVDLLEFCDVHVHYRYPPVLHILIFHVRLQSISIHEYVHYIITASTKHDQSREMHFESVSTHG